MSYNSRSLISGTDFHDTVGVNLKGHLNLRNTMRSRRNTGKLKLAKQIVVLVVLGNECLPS